MKHILLVDDQLDIQEMLADLLRNRGIKVDAYANGEQASKRLEEQKYDLVITDLNMPKVDGFTLISRIQNDIEGAKNTPIIVITGGQNAHKHREEVEALEQQNIQILKKPFGRQIFLDAVCEAFGIKPSEIHTLMMAE